MSGITAGPWRVCDGHEHGVETVGGEWICDCIETPSNAHAIAALPDILAALQELVTLKDQCPPDYELRKLQARRAAREALAKAKGETQ
jgi:hypothetical protein